MSQAARNLKLAVAAMRWTNSRIKMQSNQAGDIVMSFGKSLVCVDTMRDDRKEAERSWNRSFLSHYKAGTNEAEIRRRSPKDFWNRRYMIMKYQMEKAIQHGCGNCGELSSTAFFYLYDKPARPIEKMHIKGGDHAFVVIGRKTGSRDHDPGSWGPDAAICDPWYEVACLAAAYKSELPALAKTFANPNQHIVSWYRLDGKRPLPAEAY
ncbi:MAG: hypothetical protein GVY13_00960 [Alphaproteobacteria bacterium]|nr:hypothetical protein [Alphaproteobacteria bacterium]